MEENPINDEERELELIHGEPSEEDLGEPSEEDLENLKDLEDDELDDAEEESDDDEFMVLDDAEAADSDDSDEEEDRPVMPLVVGGFDAQDEIDADDDALQDDDAEGESEADGDLEAEMEEDLTQLLEERLAEENFNGQSAQGAAATAKEAEWSCDECFLIVSASQFGSPKNPRCPSDELNCPLLGKVKVG